MPGTPDEQVQRPYIESRDLFKIFKPADLEVVALRGVDLDVQRGELMAIVG
ncbi:MAG TPA: ABC transporter ATP-binding protein, partial [Dehalococcoidia bacterium]|nr:ABC transporter ATP-binding protein [Dehalococcoidia bacterium]